MLLTVAGCRVGPNYKRPAVPTAPEYRGAEQDVKATGSAAQTIALGDQKWWDVFADPQLQELIRKGLQQNYDVRVAAERIVQANAQLGITRANQFPTLNGTADYTGQRVSQASLGIAGFSPEATNTGSLGLSASWNLDFWGKYRSATEAARAQMLSSEWAHRAVLSTVVMDIATGYFQLRTLDLQLEVSKRTLAARQESLKLTRALNDGGAGTLLDVRQSEQLVLTAQEEIPDLERQIEQEEDTICALLGENPHPIPRGLPIDQQPHPPTVPAGLPSTLLERRPDILEAEANLIAANAEIGVARAAYFPQISLTGSASTQTNQLSKLFSGPSYAWNYGPTSVSVPIFNAGSIRNNVRMTESEERQALLTYQQTIANAFRDVSKSLVAYRKYREYREQQEQLTASAQDAARLSQALYQEGQDSYLEVLTSDTNYFTAELNLAIARQNELLSLVQLYNALGGGWETK
jgi:multidrug efflux system outer membrane protein